MILSTFAKPENSQAEDNQSPSRTTRIRFRGNISTKRDINNYNKTSPDSTGADDDDEDEEENAAQSRSIETMGAQWVLIQDW